MANVFPQSKTAKVEHPPLSEALYQEFSIVYKQFLLAWRCFGEEVSLGLETGRMRAFAVEGEECFSDVKSAYKHATTAWRRYQDRKLIELQQEAEAQNTNGRENPSDRED
ncbi:MAG: hypothetical protein AB1656_05100 [Candidatus Omnitrophota bacterium]